MSLLVIMCVLAMEPKELLPGAWVDDGIVEFDATIAMDCHHPETPDVYLEMLITGPDTREHESLLVSPLKPSSLHAALLAAGFEQGHPIQFSEDGNRTPATGDQLLVQVQLETNDEWIDLLSWVRHVEHDTPLLGAEHWDGLVFAGSELNDDGIYRADREGALVSLTAWGFEVVSPVWILSPDASQDEPVWIANRDEVPEFGDPVRVRIVAALSTTEDAAQESSE
ncbi:MAG: YdjY domain-containing protein [Phycisphaerales bacterium]